MKALARLVGPMPGHNHPIKLHNLLLEAEQLNAGRGKARAGNLGHPFVARVGNTWSSSATLCASWRQQTARARRRIERHCQELRYAFAVFKSAVSRPSLKRSYTDCRRLRASASRP
jgi:hypothetical protein